MALPVPKSGYSRFMKEGAKHFKGADEAVLRNIEACTELAGKLRTAFGPNGMNKMVINHIEKLFVTNDAATILNELEIQHPAARLLVLAAQMQEKQIGDYTNSVIILAADMLERSAELLHMGLKPIEVADAYDMAFKQLEKVLPSMVVRTASEMQNLDCVKEFLKASISSKQFDHQDFITDLVAKACVQTVPKNSSNFNVDSIRICKIIGSGVQYSRVMNGMVFKRGTEGSVKKVDNARIAVFACPVDVTQTETKGTILMNTADDLKKYAVTEEGEVEGQIKSLADAGVNVIVANGKFGDIYLHFLNKYNIMAVRLTSKFDLRRLSRSIGAQPQSRLCTPSPDLLGQCDRVFLEEIGDTDVTVFDKDSEHGNIATIIVRGSSQSRMDDVERAIDDAVNTYKALSKDGRLLAGAGAVDMRASQHIEQWGKGMSGIEQYGIKRYALALSVLPKQLAKNNGHEPTVFLSKLIKAHQGSNCDHGIDLITGDVMDAVTNKIYDLYAGKLSCYRLATEAVSTILRVDQIIMAKQATGGPKPRNPLPQDGGDDDGMV